MYNTTAEFKTEIKKPSRSFECRVTIGDLTFNNEDIVDIKLDGNIQPGDGFSIGSTTSQVLDLTLLNSLEHIYSTNQIKLEIGLKIGSKIEYILIGYYNIDDIEKTDYTTKFTAYDNMIKFETPYFSKLGNTATLQQIVNELSTMTGVQFTGSLPAYNLKKLEGFTCREILGFIASICGGNALITREGKFTIILPKEIDYALTTENYFDYKREEAPYKVGKVSCQVGENIISKGSLGTDSMELEFENPWVNESILTDIYNKLKGFSYLGYSMKWQGDISLDVGDIITVTDTKGAVRKLPILSQSFTYTGGLTSEISAQGESKNKNSFSSNGNMNNKVDRVVTELLIVNEALINKANIQDLKATNVEIQNLKVANAEIENALIKCATIEQLSATNANIQNLIAEDARINQAIINKADITDLNATNGKITILESEVAKIGVIEGNVANIEDIINGNLSSENIQAGAITGDRLNMSTIFVNDANIINVNASKMNTGELNTNKVKIKSEDGGIEIVGATQQFKDKNNKVRIQMGKDTQGNFNFIIRGEDGTSILIDHNGIKEKAITDNLIKESMIAPDVIGEKNINYNSFTTGFNKDTNTSTIKGTKVRLDNQNQTLEVGFTSLKNQADGTKTVTESNTTSINVQQGQINTAIANTKIVKDGKEILLKDDYNTTVQTVNSMKNTLSSHTTTIDHHTGKITGVESRTNVLERDLNSMSSKLSSTESTVTNHTTQINTAQSTANTANTNATNAQSTANNAVNKADKAQSDATSANMKVDGLEVATKNIIFNSGNFKVIDYWVNNGGMPIVEEKDGFKCLSNRNGKSIKHEKIKLEHDTNYIYQTEIKFDSDITIGTTTPLHCWVGDMNTPGGLIGLDGAISILNGSGVCPADTWVKIILKMKTKTKNDFDNDIYLTPFIYYGTSGPERFWVKNIKLARGNRADEWSPAIEDTQKQIDKNKNDIITVNTEITTTKNKVSAIEQNMDSITQRVGSVETTTTSHTATINNHTSSLNAVDGKINTAKNNAVIDARKIEDRRGTNENPLWYMRNYPRQTIYEFKFANVIGVSTSPVFGTLTTAIPWNDNSGGYPVQTFKSNNTSVYERKGTSDTEWSSWSRLEDVTGSQNKADQALNDSKAFTNVEVNKVITSTNSKFAEIKTTTDSINLEVNNTKKEIDKVTVKFDNMQISERNLLPDTDFSKDKKSKYKAWGGATVIEYSKDPMLGGFKRPSQILVRNTKPTEDNSVLGISTPKVIGGLIAGKEYTLSFKAMSRGNTSHLNYLYILSNETGVNNEIFVSEGNKIAINPYDKADKISYVTFIPKKNYPQASILIARTDKIVAETTYNAFGIWDIKLTQSNKVGDWSPAPEEVNNEILDVTTTKINEAKADIKITTDAIKQSVSNVDSKTTTINNTLNNTNSEVNTLKSKTTTLETNLTGITGRVTNVESSTATINGEVTSIKSRVQTAENKLTATSIINSVNEAITGGKAITGTSTKLTKDSFTVENTSGRKVVIKNGDIATHNSGGNRFINTDGTRLIFRNWKNDVELLDMLQVTSEFDGVSYSAMALGLQPGNPALFISDSAISGNLSEYNTKIRVMRGGGAHSYIPINTHGHDITIGKINNSTNQEIFIGATGMYIQSNEMNTCAKSGNLYLNYWRGAGAPTSVKTRIGDGSKGSYGPNGHGDLVCGGLWVHGDKHCVQNIDNLGFIGMHAYETAESFFGDIGSGVTNEECICYVYIDPIMRQTVNTDVDYKVFLENTNEDLAVIVRVIDKTSNYFKVKSNKPNATFDFELKARRRGHENKRLTRLNEEVIIPNAKAEEKFIYQSKNKSFESLEIDEMNFKNKKDEQYDVNEALKDKYKEYIQSPSKYLLDINEKIKEEMNYGKEKINWI
ncbi:MAG: alanine-zipper protein [Clostridium sp.]|uniref:alanine-zipper protein n=1 Tax=Clostridium sp. TaxID=1506 RepID=UPI003F35C96C